MINDRHIVVFDFETGGKDPMKVEITQIAAVVIHPQKLTVIDTFNSEVRPLEPDKLEDEALKITRKTREKLALAPHPKTVWQDFTTFVQKYNTKKSNFGSPIPAGYNIINYDMPIVGRYCELYGPMEKGKQAIFSNWMAMDLMHHAFHWWYNSKDMPDLKFTTLREYLGLSSENAHDALNDVQDCAKVLIKFMKLYERLRVGTPTQNPIKFKGAFGS